VFVQSRLVARTQTVEAGQVRESHTDHHQQIAALINVLVVMKVEVQELVHPALVLLMIETLVANVQPVGSKWVASFAVTGTS